MQDAKITSNNNVSGTYPEVGKIRADLKALKTDVGDLARHVKEDGLHDISEKANHGVESLQGFVKKMEKKVQEQPAQSLAIAFVTGMVLNYFLRHK
ncbi:MAG: hypothetical protein GC136_00855 [Alphaproteobacteria bacterium]|nr:hypothetical protein [Alphaproteobacteria bacterium]